MRRAWFVAVALVTACSLVRDLDGFDDEFGKQSPDSGRDAGDAGEGGMVVLTTGWCARNTDAASFCADFDDGAGTSHFDNRATLGGTIAVDSTASADGSAPASLVAVGTASATETKVNLSKVGKPGATFVTFGADVRIDKVNEKTGNAGQPIGVYFEGTSVSYQVGVSIAGAQRTTSIFEYNDPDDTSYRTLGNIPSIADGKFHRVDIEVDIMAKTLAVRVDGVATSGFDAMSPRITQGRTNLIVGIAYANGDHDGWTIRVDNVTLFSR